MPLAGLDLPERVGENTVDRIFLPSSRTSATAPETPAWESPVQRFNASKSSQDPPAGFPVGVEKNTIPYFPPCKNPGGSIPFRGEVRLGGL
jgi:hypothetical protein